MATSGTYNFNLTNSNCVLGAYGRLQVRPAAIVQSHMFDAQRELNLQQVEWSNRQVNLWKVDLQTIALIPGQATYPVDPATVMILDLYVAIQPGSSSPIDRYITAFSRSEFASIARKKEAGPPAVYWFDRLISPTITFWPVPNNTGQNANFFRCLRVQDCNIANAETPDVQYRWLDCMTAGLSHRLSRYYKPELEKQRKIDYDESWHLAGAQDTENVNQSIVPSIMMYYRR